MKIAVHFSIIPALALALASCGVSPEERLSRAEEAYAENRFSEARLDLGMLLQRDDADVRVLELLARTQVQLGDGEGAVATLERLAAAGARPADYDALMAEAMLLAGNYAGSLAAGQSLGTANGLRIVALSHVAMSDLEAALAAFERGLDAPGDRSRLLADFALFAKEAGDWERAAELSRAALVADPDGLDPLLAAAQVTQALGRPADALRHYEAAADTFPESRAAILGQIGVLGDMGRIAEARQLVEQAAQRTPDDPDVIYLQARLAAEDGDWAAARDILQPIEGREDARLQLLYARALLELDLTEQALGRLSALVRRSPQAIAPRRLLARAQLQSGDAAAAFATIQPLANSPEGSPADLALYADAARRSGREGQIDAALRQAPPAERVATLLARADADLQAQRWRSAIEAYEQLRGWTGDSNAMVLNNLAYAKAQTGQYAEALPLARRALELSPQQPNIMDTTGWLLVQSGEDRAAGIALLEEAARLAPGNAAIARHLREARAS
ncbi:tetratricopeptide repeat protein [Aurantiacibacter gangjinensis]|uniref:Uncharacterized protein n=1 Tax=Aurantiacibacter gangjinensis TaxID=502682 RepID=A0A0G9MQ59_9SPHN|nr:tetratricopeptide repeat protein [Aurantiacibacter gangjinensis]APE28709.1 TPR repeat protein [Aurantiacibacter gangjinensis]KLE32872.1 hypothetical protein AAW01_02295 [Aurantiacibacter gangjinensis]